METQLKTSLQDRHWLNAAELVAVAGSFGGIIGGFLLQEAYSGFNSSSGLFSEKLT